MALPLGSPHWVSSGRQLSLHGSKVFGATVGVSQPWEGGARLPNPLPPRSTKPLTCPVSPPAPRVSGSESQPGQGQSPPVVCSEWQSRRVWPGGPGEGDGHWAPPRAAGPSPHLGLVPGLRLGTQAEPEGGETWARRPGRGSRVPFASRWSQRLLGQSGSDSGRPSEEGLPGAPVPGVAPQRAWCTFATCPRSRGNGPHAPRVPARGNPPRAR